VRSVIVALGLISCAPLPPSVLLKRQHAALERHDWLEALQLGRARVAVRPFDPAARYDLACAQARAGDALAALSTLGEAVSLGFDNADALARDDDLASLRGAKDFGSVVERARRTQRDGIAAASGMKTVLHDELAMPLRLRLAADGRRLKLAVWLHPFGARANHDVERLAPMLFARGYALAVPLALHVEGWTDADLVALLDRSVPALATEVDVSHPLLLGLSAGAQAALVAWSTAPQKYAGLIISAPPADLLGHRLPDSPASPIELSVGDDDPVRGEWERVAAAWRSSGIDLHFTVVAGRGHEFLFDEALLTRALEALEATPRR
jgi:dienelactone hydrolase